MYTPDEKILDKYADVLINFALNNCEGVKKGQVVLLNVPENAKPLLVALRRAVLKAGAHSITRFLPDNIEREFYELANEEQLNFFPDKYMKGIVEQIDCTVSIIADADLHELEGVNPGNIMKKSKAFKPYKDWLSQKENKGEFSWTLALYGTEALAKEAGMSLEDYWSQIIKACYLDEENPVQKWKESVKEIDRVRGKLNSLKIEKLHVKSEGTDFTIGIGENREWLGGRGNNIPSFEVFISPDNRVASGKVSFTEPLYRYGNLIEGIVLEFENGKVISAKAEKGEDVLKEMIATEGADRIGEFSLTDARLSKIDKFMATTLFDENVGKEFGNMHVALGSAYKDSYPGNPSEVSEEDWNKMGYNDSVVHTDIVSTDEKEVTALLKDGSSKVIYRSGRFLI